MSNSFDVYTALTALVPSVPVAGVSCPSMADKTTWRVDYTYTYDPTQPAPTDAQIAQVQAAITAFVVNA